MMGRVSNRSDWWKREKRERERDGWIRIVEWGGDQLRADREGGKTESRWQSWHLSYTKICLEPFSTCLKKKAGNSAYYAKKILSGFNPLWPCPPFRFSLIMGCPPLWTGAHTNTLSNPSTLSHPGLVSKQRGHSEQERVSFKALICGPHAAQQQRTDRAPQ